MGRENIPCKHTFFICGAGPAGLIAGISLCRLGHQVTIIDREPIPHRPVCGEYLSPQGVEILHKLGLSSSLEGFEPIWGMMLFSPGGRAVQANFPENRYGQSLNRKRFQANLATIFTAYGGSLQYGETLISLEQSNAGLKITTSSQTYEVDALIGADGRSSTAAKLAKVKMSSASHQRVAIHAYLSPLTPLNRCGQMHILRDGSYAGINPINENEVNFSIVTDAENVKKFGGAKNLLNKYIEGSEYLRAAFSPLKDEKIKTTFPINCAPSEIVKNRLALIGDASGFIDPLTGEGITTALKTADLLVKSIQSAPSLEAAFLAYGKARKKEFLEKESFNRALQRLIAYPILCEGVGRLLHFSPRIRSHFIGVIGNIYTPLEAAKKLVFSWNKIGGHKNAKNSERLLRLSPSQELPRRDSGPAKENLARARSGS